MMEKEPSGVAYWNRHAKDYDRALRMLAGSLPRMLELTRSEVAGAGDVVEVAASTGLVTVALAGCDKPF